MASLDRRVRRVHGGGTEEEIDHNEDLAKHGQNANLSGHVLQACGAYANAFLEKVKD